MNRTNRIHTFDKILHSIYIYVHASQKFNITSNIRIIFLLFLFFYFFIFFFPLFFLNLRQEQHTSVCYFPFNNYRRSCTTLVWNYTPLPSPLVLERTRYYVALMMAYKQRRWPRVSTRRRWGLEINFPGIHHSSGNSSSSNRFCPARPTLSFSARPLPPLRVTSHRIRLHWMDSITRPE